MRTTKTVDELLAELETVKLNAYLDRREAFQDGYDLGVENTRHRPRRGAEEADVVWRRYIYLKDRE